jgi:hypothetical protein
MLDTCFGLFMVWGEECGLFMVWGEECGLFMVWGEECSNMQIICKYILRLSWGLSQEAWSGQGWVKK